MSNWPTPCDNEFERLAKDDPAQLIAWIRSGEMSPGLLTRAAEALGDAHHADTLAVLLDLVQHAAPVVREGALLGIGRRHSLGWRLGVRLVTDVARLRVEYISRNDTSPAVRQTAVDILEEIDRDA